MAIIERTTSAGSKITSSLTGNININESTGQIVIRQNGISRILIGSHPADGHQTLDVSAEGVDVIEELLTDAA